VEKQFFPSSDRPEVLVDISLQEGSGIRATTAVADRVEAILKDAAGVESLSSYIGAGAPRFFLALNPELPNPAFAKLIIVAHSPADRDNLMERLQSHIDAGDFPEARVRVHKLLYGPPVIWPVVFRVVGPDAQALRKIAGQVRERVAANPNTLNAHLDWGERAPVVRLKLDPERLRLIGLTPRELAGQLEYELSGLPATEIREDVRNVQLVLRGLVDTTGAGAGHLADINIKTLDGRSVPLGQAGVLAIDFEDPVLKRYNREPVLAVQADVTDAQPPDVTQAIWADLQDVIATLPPGYRIDIGGSVEQSGKADASIQKVQPIMLGLILIVIMLQMRSFSGTLMVIATAPLGIIGATLALLIADRPFGFVALLGLIGLAGILMRNTLILAKQIEDNLHQGMEAASAVIDATVRRSRPVVLTAAAAVFAFIPLTTDTFWGPLAFVLIGGIIVGTAVTLLFLPALYALWFRIGWATKRTRKREFLDEMERVVPWAALVELVAPTRPRARRAARRSRSRRCCASTSCSSGSTLSDPAMEEALHDVPLFREFAGLGGDHPAVPPPAGEAQAGAADAGHGQRRAGPGPDAQDRHGGGRHATSPRRVRPRTKTASATRRCTRPRRASSGVCHEHRRQTCGAVPKMGAGLPKPACRSRLQTTRCCCVQKARW
jgi:multidrug efflux pump subunit AcrB